MSESYRMYAVYHEFKETHKDITYMQYSKVIGDINEILIRHLLAGEQIVFPLGMGSLDIRVIKWAVGVNNGKLYTTLPVDWNSTKKLWAENPECKVKKTLIRFEPADSYVFYYSKYKAKYVNKEFYNFYVPLSVRKRLNKIIKSGVELKVPTYNKYGKNNGNR